MSGSRALACVMFALLLAAEAAPLRADLPPPRPDPVPTPKEMYPDDPIPRPKPRRPGLFRTCGTGTPAALAAIGASWAMLWLGTRFVGRVHGAKNERTS